MTSHDAWDEPPGPSTCYSCGEVKVRNSRMDILRHNSPKHSIFQGEKYGTGFGWDGSHYIKVE